jgi:hypothetical protein
MADRTDLDRLRAMTDAEIERAVREDPDSFIPDARCSGRSKKRWIASSLRSSQ